MTLPINELFDTIQGEGFFTGTPATFVRLQGCAVGCPWCDTKHTWETGVPLEIGFAEVLAKVGDGALYARVDESTILDELDKRKPGHVVITGGEPCQYDLMELTAGIMRLGKTCQIETSGTQLVLAKDETWVTVSPKISMPGGHKIVAGAVAMASEVKFPVGKQADVDTLVAFLREFRVDPTLTPVWLQPLSTSDKATSLCVQVATEQGWRVSLQVHKYAGLR